MPGNPVQGILAPCLYPFPVPKLRFHRLLNDCQISGPVEQDIRASKTAGDIVSGQDLPRCLDVVDLQE